MSWQMFKDSIPVYFVLPWLIPLFFAIIGLAFIPGGDRAIGFIRAMLDKIAAQWWRAVLLVGVIAIILVGTPWAMGKVRPPEVHDEISYLLAADTFLHGRLTNPTPQFWRNLQTFHELMIPTYQSKFPVGQGIALAAGKLLGSFRIGAFGTVALASAATCWMLMAVLPRPWAIVGGLLAAVHPLVFAWGQTFWGGGVAMLGGALLTGSALRLSQLLKIQPIVNTEPLPRDSNQPLTTLDYAPVKQSPRIEASDQAAIATSSVIKSSIIGAIGYGILMNSRPLEGTILGVFLLIWLIITARTNRRSLITLWLKAVPIGLLSLLPFFAFMALYNYRVTGSATMLPYSLHSQEYMHSPLFWWQSPHEPTILRTPPHMAAFYTSFETGEWQVQQTFHGFMEGVERKVLFIARDALMPIVMLLVLLVGAPFALRSSSSARLAWVCCLGLLTVHMLITPWLRSQYLGPIMPLFVLAVMMSLRAVNRWRPLNRPLGSAAALALFAVCAVAAFNNAIAIANMPATEGAERETILATVEKLAGKHLVFVVYSSGAQNLYEWVNNSADIESQRVIFIHPFDMDTVNEIRGYYSDRSLWQLTVSGDRAQLALVMPSPTAEAARKAQVQAAKH